MPLSFISTRGTAPALDLQAATMTGLASDGGLYVPASWPQFDAVALATMAGSSYAETALQVLRPFAEGSLPLAALQDLIAAAYRSFDTPEVTPLKQLTDKLWVLELFHGPTFAFKDIALQLLGGVFDTVLQQSGERITVIGATSGDTGSAAMAALAGRQNIDVFILYPAKGPSEIQRRQMTCLDAPNVRAIAIDGSFDDCQALVKALFADPALRAKHKFAAVNSINAFRLLAQMVYYFKAASQFTQPVSFAVPTGNFGNVYAGYAARLCGAPIARLAVASNQNDILPRFFATGRMQAAAVHNSLSPSMDIQVSSNAERLLFDLCGRDGGATAALMQELASGGCTVTPAQLGRAQEIFAASSADDAQTLQTIKDVYQRTGYLADPHTAVGLHAAQALQAELPGPVIALACAHPAKFPDTVERAIGQRPALPPALAALLHKTERRIELPADLAAITTFVSERIAA